MKTKNRYLILAVVGAISWFLFVELITPGVPEYRVGIGGLCGLITIISFSRMWWEGRHDPPEGKSNNTSESSGKP